MFLEVLKKLTINIHFFEALELILTLANFMNDILNNKRLLGEFDIINLAKKCSVII